MKLRRGENKPEKLRTHWNNVGTFAAGCKLSVRDAKRYNKETISTAYCQKYSNRQTDHEASGLNCSSLGSIDDAYRVDEFH